MPSIFTISIKPSDYLFTCQTISPCGDPSSTVLVTSGICGRSVKSLDTHLLWLSPVLFHKKETTFFNMSHYLLIKVQFASDYHTIYPAVEHALVMCIELDRCITLAGGIEKHNKLFTKKHMTKRDNLEFGKVKVFRRVKRKERM